MGLLTNDTLKDYLKSDIMHLVDSFKGKKYLLIHGTADGNSMHCIFNTSLFIYLFIYFHHFHHPCSKFPPGLFPK